MNRIKFRRGSLNNKKNIDIEDGEPIYLTDTKRLYVSNEDVAINNVYVGSQEPNDPGINVWINPEGVGKVPTKLSELENDTKYISVNDFNYCMMYYNNTTTQGGKWSNIPIQKSGEVVVGNKITINGTDIIIGKCSFLKISCKVSVTDESYNYHGNIILNVNGNDYEFRFNGSRCYVISNFIVDVRENENTTVSLRKYTGSEVDKIITTDKYNYMSVEVVG